MTVTYKEYMEAKMAFFKYHNCDWKVKTSGMDEYGRWTKSYFFEDAGEWHEEMTPVIRTCKVAVENIHANVDVKLLQTEFWHTGEDGASQYTYEAW